MLFVESEEWLTASYYSSRQIPEILWTILWIQNELEICVCKQILVHRRI